MCCKVCIKCPEKCVKKSKKLREGVSFCIPYFSNMFYSLFIVRHDYSWNSMFLFVQVSWSVNVYNRSLQFDVVPGTEVSDFSVPAHIFAVATCQM